MNEASSKNWLSALSPPLNVIVEPGERSVDPDDVEVVAVVVEPGEVVRQERTEPVLDDVVLQVARGRAVQDETAAQRRCRRSRAAFVRLRRVVELRPVQRRVLVACGLARVEDLAALVQVRADVQELVHREA